MFLLSTLFLVALRCFAAGGPTGGVDV